MKVEYRDDNIAILTDLRSPYTALGDHPEWRPQFLRTIRHSRTHAKLSEKLAPYAPYVLCYTKIWPDRNQIEQLVDFENPTICIMSSVGEHGMTPWLVLHNVFHTVISQNMWVKRGVKKVLKLDDDYCIAPIQAQLVDCASARLGMIPNINELIFELFTSWLWYGETASPHKELREYCDTTFSRIMNEVRGTYFWHKYRCPTYSTDESQPWIENTIKETNSIKLPPVPGKPGFSKPGMFAKATKRTT